ncbi:MAG: glycosyltransferase family 39 protein [Bacteroidia bacterium]
MNRKQIIIIVSLLLLVGLFSGLSQIELRAEEPRRAVVSMEMVITGDYVVPHITGLNYYNKPPAFNWLMALFFKLFGSFDEWVVRLPSLLSLVGLSLVHFFFSKQYIGNVKAALSSLFLISAADMLFYGSVNSGEIDLFYALICYLQVAFIFYYYKHKKWWLLFILSYGFATVGFLTKGVPTLAFQALTLLVYFGVKKDLKRLISMQHAVGILLFVGINALYLYSYSQEADVNTFLIRQFKEASQRTAAESNWLLISQQFFSFPIRFFVLLLPWGLFLVTWFKKGRMQSAIKNDWIQFCLVFVLANIGLYWISGEFKARYYYMFFPFVLSCLVYYAHHFFEHKGGRITWSILLIVLSMLSFFSLFFPSFQFSFGKLVLMFVQIVGLSFFLMLGLKTQYRMLSMIGILALARIAFNFSYLPAYQEDHDNTSYRESCAQIVEITQDKPIYLITETYKMESVTSLGPLKVEETEISSPLLAYQIPYYISKLNQHVLKYVDEPQSGEFHLVAQDMLKDDWESLATVRDGWVLNKTFHLVRLP